MKGVCSKRNGAYPSLSWSHSVSVKWMKRNVRGEFARKTSFNIHIFGDNEKEKGETSAYPNVPLWKKKKVSVFLTCMAGIVIKEI